MPNLTDEQKTYLLNPFLDEEIRAAAFSMGPAKAPGPDGIPPGFFQKHCRWWVGKYVKLWTISSLGGSC